MSIQLVSSIASANAASTVQKTPRQAEDALRAGPAEGSAPDPEQLQQAVRDIRKIVESTASELNISIDQESGKTVVRVIDSATRKLIRQIPSEEVMSVSRAINRLAGFLVQEQA